MVSCRYKRPAAVKKRLRAPSVVTSQKKENPLSNALKLLFCRLVKHTLTYTIQTLSAKQEVMSSASSLCAVTAGSPTPWTWLRRRICVT